MKAKLLLTPILAATGLLLAAAFPANAQPAGGGGGRGMSFLSEDHRAKMQEINRSPEIAQLNTKLAAAQKEAVTAAMAENPDESVIRSKIEAVHKLQTDLALAHFKAMKEVLSSLSSDEKPEMNTRPAQMTYGMLFGGFGGGGRRGGGGGGGNRN